MVDIRFKDGLLCISKDNATVSLTAAEAAYLANELNKKLLRSTVRSVAAGIASALENKLGLGE